MAEKKNFTIENYNGTDYDILYPQTNSGQVKLDALAQDVINLGSGTNMNDAIQTITQEGGVYKVGDTLISARTGLGDKWLLQNGAKFTSAQYPELATLFNMSISNPTLIASAPSANEFMFVTEGKPGEILATYNMNVYSISYPFTSWNTTTAQGTYGSVIMPAYDQQTQNYYTAFDSVPSSGPSTNSSFNPYYGFSFDGLTKTSGYVKGLPLGFSYSNNKLYALSWQRSDGANYGNIFEKGVSNTSFTSLNKFLGGTIPNQSKLIYFKMIDSNRYVVCTQYMASAMGSGNKLFVSGVSVDIPNNRPAVAMNSSKLFAFKTKTSGSGTALSIVDPTSSTLNWVESNITTMGTYQSIVATDNIAWATVSKNATTTVYQSATADFSVWYQVATIPVNIIYSHYDSTHNKLFFISPLGRVYSSDVGSSFSIPTFSPATGLYAYIRAKA